MNLNWASAGAIITRYSRLLICLFGFVNLIMPRMSEWIADGSRLGNPAEDTELLAMWCATSDQSCWLPIQAGICARAVLGELFAI